MTPTPPSPLPRLSPLSPLSPRPPREPVAIRAQVVARLCETLGCAPEVIDPQAPFASYGLGSRDAVVLSGDLEEWLGQPLSPTVFYEHPTVEALVAHLSGTVRPPHAPLTTSATVDCRIAIIGTACRFPGAPDADAFWQLLVDGRSGIQRLPPEREALIGRDAVSGIPDHGRWGGFVSDVDAFDASFFGIGAAEAESMDPQQRLLLEVAWHALEDAGQSVDALAGSRTGVYVGISTCDYAFLRDVGTGPVDTYFGTSNSPSVAAGRLSYTFDFHGPTLAVDTACSSSLVAVHLACQSLERGESDLAVAGGVNLMLAPETTTWACRARILSETGQCRTFDAAANGYVRGEGCGVVVLKRLADALAAGDPIVAVIRGSAINHDGRSSGLAAPNGTAQQRVIADALARAGVAPADVHYVEAHGTGTVLGDPIEIRALGATLCQDRSPDDPLVVGSVKTNIGHLEAAAGVAGLIKAALLLRHGTIPSHLHLTRLNPYIAAEQLPLAIPLEARPWPADGPHRVAAVSAFGLSGTNAHVVLERAPVAVPLPAEASAGHASREVGPWLLPISARSEAALRDRVSTLHAWLRTQPVKLGDLSFTACTRRAHHAYRVAVAGSDAGEMVDALAAWLAGHTHVRLFDGQTGAASSSDPHDAVADAARAFVAHRAVAWDRLVPAGSRVVPLPAYPFQPHRHWRRGQELGEHAPASAGESPILRKVRAAGVDQREHVVLVYLRDQLALGLQVPAGQVPSDAPMARLGLDSLVAIDIANRIAADLKVRVPPVDLFEQMSLTDLASLVLDLLEATEHAGTAAPTSSAPVEELLL